MRVSTVLLVGLAASRVAIAKRVGMTNFYDLCDQVQGALGYPCEHVNVTTGDGFVLDVVHIPPRANATAAYPVVLQHGLLDSAVTFFANAHPYQNLACMLHDAGYDVYVPNSRGNHYSMANTQYNSGEAEYWRRIDMDFMASEDLPAVIDTVLRLSGRTTLTWVGHSQGTWQAFSAFSTSRPEYAAKVDLFVALAPACRVKHQRSWILSLLADLDVPQILALFGDKEFLANDWLIRQFTKICPDIGELCPDVLELIVGNGNVSDYNRTQLQTILR